ncbi:MAG TPA: hypothetical protein VFO10_20665 [Oligoflexus sp.]|uniref:hypothetical protein n=1 Tax=Oligoflexus sp. TaxID=1971216 RepID=UPI002D803554|nr:hypothetical protein [Oligoflexus sp.]HET9239685.1 hypothetical protein [Oligoflexus sp.]
MASACRAPIKDARSQLPVIFPDAARALGPFSIHLEKSRESSALSSARVKVEQTESGKHITVQIKMIHIQEQVALSFVPQSEPSNGSLSASQCTTSPSMLADAVALPSGHRAPPLQKAAALFHLPLPRSIREASSLQVTGAGDTWSVFDDALVWNPKKDRSSEIALSWIRQDIPETRYPLRVKERPRHLQARVIQDNEGEGLSVDWVDGFVTLDASDVKEGAWLELQYDIEDRSSSLLLPQIPAFGNMNILSFQTSCPRDAFLLERDELSWNCPMEKGPLWAVSYSFRQPQDAWDFHDWPELSSEAPALFNAMDDEGEKIEVVVEPEGRVLPKSPPDAARICLKASWFSDKAR